MKISTTLIYSSLLSIGCVQAKNVFSNKFKAENVDNFEKEIKLAKRDAKRVVDINLKADTKEFISLNSRDEHAFIIPGEENEEGELKYTLMPNILEGTLASALVQLKEISIFSSYLRDMVDLYKKCENADPEIQSENNKGDKMLLIFAPTDDAVEELDVKPWAFPNKITEANNNRDQTTTKNLENFVESHVVEVSNVSESFDKAVSFKTLNGNIVQMKNENGDFQISLEDVDEWLPVKKIELLSNGAVLIIDRTLTWPGRTI